MLHVAAAAAAVEPAVEPAVAAVVAVAAAVAAELLVELVVAALAAAVLELVVGHAAERLGSEPAVVALAAAALEPAALEPVALEPAVVAEHVAVAVLVGRQRQLVDLEVLAFGMVVSWAVGVRVDLGYFLLDWPLVAVPFVEPKLVAVLGRLVVVAAAVPNAAAANAVVVDEAAAGSEGVG